MDIGKYNISLSDVDWGYNIMAKINKYNTVDNIQTTSNGVSKKTDFNCDALSLVLIIGFTLMILGVDGATIGSIIIGALLVIVCKFVIIGIAVFIDTRRGKELIDSLGNRTTEIDNILRLNIVVALVVTYMAITLSGIATFSIDAVAIIAVVGLLELVKILVIKFGTKPENIEKAKSKSTRI